MNDVTRYNVVDGYGYACHLVEAADGKFVNAAEYDALHARVAELQPMAECAAIMAVCGYFSRMRGPDFYAYQFPTCVRFSADTYNGSRPLHAIPLYAGSAPVPEAQAIDTSTALSVLSKAMQDDADFAWTWHCNIAMTAQDSGAPHDRANVWAADFMRRAFDVDTLTRVREMPAAQAEAKVADDARLGNRLYVWDYENPEDGSWDNIEEYLHDTTPGVGDVVRLNLALPLHDVEVEMLEVGECGEPIRWEVRDVKTGAMLAAKAKWSGT